jgi:hypothetical protein
MDHGCLVATIAISIWLLPLTRTLCQTCKTFQTAWMVAAYFQKSTLSKGITRSQLLLRKSLKWPLHITPFGLFEYLFTPFGLSNATQTSKEW